MAVQILTDEQKRVIKVAYMGGRTMESLAKDFKVSRRTIGRVLEEQGIVSEIKKSKEQDQEFLDMLKKYNVQTPEQLERIFLTPALVLPNVLAFLQEANESELAYLFYEAALSKIKERMKAKEQPTLNERNLVKNVIH